QLDQPRGRMLVFDRADEHSATREQIDRLGVAREWRFGIDVHKPRGAKSDHALVGFWEKLARGVEINHVSFEGAIDTAIVDSPDDLAIVHALARADRFFAVQS